MNGVMASSKRDENRKSCEIDIVVIHFNAKRKLPKKNNTALFLLAQQTKHLSLCKTPFSQNTNKTPHLLIYIQKISTRKGRKHFRLMEKVLTLLQPRNIEITLLRYFRELQR
jgi:hypothetical protein